LKSLILTLALVAAVTTANAAAQPDSGDKPPPPPPPRVLGPELWHGARTGMGEEDVSKLFPNATPSKGEALPAGSKSALQLKTELAGLPATAQFFFSADGDLTTIIIDRADVAAHKTNDNLAKAHKVADQLTADYGKAQSCSEQPQLASLTCTWNLGEAKAILSYRDIAGNAPALNVTYRKRSDIKPWAPRPVKHLRPR
jgi:hypothetical protein